MGIQLKKMFSILGGVMAFITIVALALLYINAQFTFINNVNVIKVLSYIKEYALIATVGIVALEFAANKGLIVFVVTVVLVAIVVIFSFLPGVQETLIGYIK